MISGKTTLASVTKHAQERGYEPVQIDGIPEGFSYKIPDITISGVAHMGGYIAFVPLVAWEYAIVRAQDEEQLLTNYNKKCLK